MGTYPDRVINQQKFERIQRVGQTADLPLFDGKPDPKSYVDNDGKETRDAAHKALKDMGAKETAVYALLTRSGPMTDRQIADELGWEINQVTGRRSGLLKQGRVVKYGTHKNVETGKENTLWRAV